MITVQLTYCEYCSHEMVKDIRAKFNEPVEFVLTGKGYNAHTETCQRNKSEPVAPAKEALNEERMAENEAARHKLFGGR